MFKKEINPYSVSDKATFRNVALSDTDYGLISFLNNF